VEVAVAAVALPVAAAVEDIARQLSIPRHPGLKSETWGTHLSSDRSFLSADFY
jgi:hypothetical protein